MIDLLGGKGGMVLGQVDDAVLTGNVSRRNDGELRPVDTRVEGNGRNAAPRNGGTHGGSVPRAGLCDVVNVQRSPGNFGETFLADGRRADNGTAFGHRN